jgi:hypothetical protein
MRFGHSRADIFKVIVESIHSYNSFLDLYTLCISVMPAFCVSLSLSFTSPYV